ncbi:hypothetical protein COX97_04050 [Candidatus Pacearchaeota archaeon CG_4_10_14_0_2_um_filter_05_32_18]|nr:MAG: hypothetical protein COX97_04050 [Candidatus Pacearchaeota archaeon CG_4_10_14_0_2_um_filter_05_32_18]
MPENNKFKCEKCEREFSSKEALEMHNNSKHYGATKGLKKLDSVNKKKIRNWAIFIVVILVIVGVAYFMAFRPETPGRYDDFAKCLTNNNVTMYGAWWCPHCKDQKELFGKSWQYVNYVECSTPDGNAQLPVCEKAGIEGYPTWELGNGSRIDRVLTLKYLSGLTDCTLP